MNAAKTLCIVLHYGPEQYTVECLKSLFESDAPLEIVVVDNDPAQNFIIPKCWTNKVTLIKTGAFKGFAEANNIGASKLNYEHHSILILNNDTTVEKGAITTLRTVLEHDGIGAVGPCMFYGSDNNKIWACGGVINKFRLRVGGLKEKKNRDFYDVDYLPGAAILCRPDVWNTVGGLSERYYLAYEEAEFALELRKYNWRVVVAPESKIIHHVGMSSQVYPKYIYNGVRNRIRFGQYIHGRTIGSFLAVLMTFDVFIQRQNLSSSFQRLQIWIWSIYDEFNGAPLSHNQLENISKKTTLWNKFK